MVKRRTTHSILEWKIAQVLHLEELEIAKAFLAPATDSSFSWSFSVYMILKCTQSQNFFSLDRTKNV